MKTLKYIVWGVLIFLWVFYVIPVGLLQIPYVQTKISDKASEILHEKLGVETKIGKVDFELFNKLILKDLYLEDQAGDTLFSAKRLAVGFELTPIFKGKLRFNTAQLFSFQVNLNKENAQAPLNLQFVLDAFASKDTTRKSSKIDLQIQALNLRRGTFSFRVKDAGSTPGKFNSKDIRIKDISAKVQIKTLTNKQLIANFSHFAFSEQSGLDVQRLSFDLSATNRKARIKRFELKLPNSLLKLKDISADYSNIKLPENYVDQTLLELKIEPSTFFLKDLSSLVPVLTNFKENITIEGHLAGNMTDLQIDSLLIQDENRLTIEANARFKDINSKDNIFIQGQINQSFISSEIIHRMVSNFNNKQTELPPQIAQLGDIRFEGEISGFLHHLNAYGIFNTGIGTLRTDIEFGRDKSLFVKGSVQSSGMDIKKLMNDESYGNASFNISVDARQDKNNRFSGKINATVGRFEYKGYGYENLSLIGAFTPTGFSGNLAVESPEGKLAAEGMFDLKGENSEFKFSAEILGVKLDRLNLSRKYKESDLSLNIKANFTGNSIDNLLGDIFLTDLRFSTEKGGYYLDTFNIKATRLENEKLLTLHSDIANGEIRGIYSLSGISSAINNTLSKYLPAFFQQPKKTLPANTNNFTLKLTIEDTEELSDILDLPFKLFNKTNIVGEYNSIYDKFKVEVYSPRLSFQKNVVESTNIVLDNSENVAKVQIKGVSLQKKDQKLAFNITSKASNNLVDAEIQWESNVKKKYSGALAFNALLIKPDKQSKLKTSIDIRETNITLNDSTWTIHPASLSIDSGKVQINKLRIDHTDQYIQIDGTVSPSVDDIIRVDLNKVNLEYVFSMLNIPALEFGGIASGYVSAQDLYKTRKLSTNLDVRSFSFNSTIFGDLALEGQWDEEKQGIMMRGNIFKDDTTKVNVDGIIYPVKEELSIVFDAQNANASFLRKYMNKIAKDISGKLNGKMRLFGNLNNPTVEGDVFVKNGGFGIEFLNTYYTFSDTVRCRPDEIVIKDINFYDKNGWAALANGSVKHKSFADFAFSAKLVFDNFLVFNATERINPYFYGTVYGSGSANIRGTEKVVNIDVSMQNTKNTKLLLNFMEASDITNYDFIHFVDKKPDTTSLVEKYFSLINNKPLYFKSNSETDIRFNLNLDANPDAMVELIMDPLTGDKIRTYGSGHMQVQYGTKTPLKMVGKYVIERGKYNFSLQQVIFRDFDIREGSSVSFHGDPYSANFNIDAVYSTMANLSDLSDDLVNYAGRSSVMVNCLLNITGAMEHPNIKFNLELPESEYLERQIKNYINTEDMLNRQVVFLLVLNRFYTPEGGQDKNQARTNEFSSLASSTLSSSLSSILNSFTDNVQLGTRIRTADNSSMTGTEVELMLSSQLLDNRLILNGNFGYRDYSKMGDDTKGLPPFIGDFDLEYKLTPGGGVRLKAYNHYNYRYYYDYRAKTTQGLGIIFRKDFERIDELFGRKRFLLPPLPNDTISVDSLNSKNDFIQFKSEPK